MTNVFAPTGAQVWRRRDGGSPTMGLETFSIGSSDVTPIFNGDMVQMSLITPISGTPSVGGFVTQASSGVAASYRGVFRGCEYYNTAVGRKVWSAFWPGSGVAGTSSATGDPMAFVEIDDQLYYVMQGSSQVTYGASNIGLNVFITTVASAVGNTTTGYSGVAIASNAPATSSSAPFRIVDFLSNQSPPGGPSVINGTDNSTSGQILILMPNNWDTKTTTGI